MRSVMKNLKQLLMKKEKHDRMKEGIRNIKNSDEKDELPENSKNNRKNIKITQL